MKTVKPLKGDTRENIYLNQMRQGVLWYSIKSTIQKRKKTGKLDFFKIKDVSASGNIKKMKNQATFWMKIFAKHTDRGFASRMSQELEQLSINKTTQFKNGRKRGSCMAQLAKHQAIDLSSGLRVVGSSPALGSTKNKNKNGQKSWIEISPKKIKGWRIKPWKNAHQ